MRKSGWKRFTGVILILAAVFGFSPLDELLPDWVMVGGKPSSQRAAAGDDHTDWIEMTAALYQSGAITAPVPPPTSARPTRALTAREAIASGLMELSVNIDVSQFDLNQAEINALYSDVVNTNPDLFFVEQHYQISYDPSSGIVLYIVPQYISVDRNVLGNMQEELAAEVAKAVASAPADALDAEKVLAVNEYLVINTEYDLNLSKFSAYDALVEKTAVCQGYALSFGLIMRELGIEWKIVTSAEMDHAWNLVYADGSWFHVDVTWNDPTPDSLGYADHSYLLLPDNIISDDDHNHTGWDASVYPYASDTSYVDFFWTNTTSQIIYDGGLWYFVPETSQDTPAIHKIISYDFDTSESTEIYTINDAIWSAGGNSYWPSWSPSLAEFGGVLYYNTPDQIFSVSFSGAEPTTIHTAELTETQAICEMKIQEGYLYYRAKETPDDVGYILSDRLKLTSGATFKLSGVVRSYNPANPTKLELIQGDEVMFDTVVEEDSGAGQIDQDFIFLGVEPGAYSLVVTKPGHTKYTIQNIVVADADVDLTQDTRPGAALITLPCGDIDGNGNINGSDLSVLWLAANYNKAASAAQTPLCDLNGDGNVNGTDLSVLWLPVNYNKGAVVVG
jgi:hypothetical protein